MKKKVIFCMALIMFALSHGCGNPDPRYQKIYDWQDRELISCIRDSGTVETEAEPKLTDVVHALSWMSKNITPTPDDEDYWQTSCETMERGKGDCEDQAILLWRLLREKGFPDDVNRIGWLAHKDDRPSHIIAIIYFPNEILAVDPTFSYQKISELDLYLQDRPFYTLIFEFNLYSIWKY